MTYRDITLIHPRRAAFCAVSWSSHIWILAIQMWVFSVWGLPPCGERLAAGSLIS
jgi:hypothetical protein